MKAAFVVLLLLISGCASKLTVELDVYSMGDLMAHAGVSRSDAMPWLIGDPNISLAVVRTADGATSETARYQDEKTVMQNLGSALAGSIVGYGIAGGLP